MESLGAPPGGHIRPADNKSPAGHRQGGSSPPPVDEASVLEAMKLDLGISRLEDLTLDNTKPKPRITPANQYKSNKKDLDPRIENLKKHYVDGIGAWADYKPNDATVEDQSLPNLDDGQSHRERLQAELAALKNAGGSSSRGGRGGRAGGVSRGGSHVGQSSSRLDSSRGDRGPKASVAEVEALLRLPKPITGSVSCESDWPNGNSFSSRGGTAIRGTHITPTRGASTRGMSTRGTSTRGTHMTTDRSSQRKATSTPTQSFSLATPETFFGPRTATPASHPPVAANNPTPPPSKAVVIIKEPSTLDIADVDESGDSGQNEIFSTDVKFDDFSQMEDRFIECYDGVLTIFSTQDGTFHLKLVHKSGQQFLLVPFTLIAAYSIESNIDEGCEIEYVGIRLRNSTDSGDISTGFRLRTLQKQSWNELMTIIRQNITEPVDATTSAVLPTHENGVPTIQLRQEELISVRNSSGSVTPEQAPDAADSANMKDMWTLKDEDRNLAEHVVETTMQSMAKEAAQIDEADKSSSSVINEPVIEPSMEQTAMAHVLGDNPPLPEVSLLRYGRSEMLRLKDRAASIDIHTFPEEIRLSDASKVDKSQDLVKKKPKNNGGINSSIWADPSSIPQSTREYKATAAARTINAKKGFPEHLQHMGGLADSRFADPPDHSHDTTDTWRPEPKSHPIGGLAASRWADDSPTATQMSGTHTVKTGGNSNVLALQNEASIPSNVNGAKADGVVNEAKATRSSSRPMLDKPVVDRMLKKQLTPQHHIRKDSIPTIEEATTRRASPLQTKPVAGPRVQPLIAPLSDGVVIDDTSAHEMASAANGLPTEVDNGATSRGRSINMSELKATRGIMSSIYATDSENDDVSPSIQAKQSIASPARGSPNQGDTSSAGRNINISKLKATRGIESSRWATDDDKVAASIPAKESIVTTTQQVPSWADKSTSSASRNANTSKLKATRGIESSRWATDDDKVATSIPAKESIVTTPQKIRGLAGQSASSDGRSIKISNLKATRGIESSRWAGDNEDEANVSTPPKKSIATTTQPVRGLEDQSTLSEGRNTNISQLKATRGIESSKFASNNQNDELSTSATPSADQSTSSASGSIDISQLKATRGIESSKFASDNQSNQVSTSATPTKQSSSTTAEHISSSSRRLDARSATFKAGSHASRTSIDGATFSPTTQSSKSTPIVSGYSPQPILASPVVRHHAIQPHSTLWAKVAVPNLQRQGAIKLIEAVLIGPPHEDVSAPGTILAYVTYADELNPGHMKEAEAVLTSPPHDRSHNYFYTHFFPDWLAPPSVGLPSGLMPMYPLGAQQNYHPAGYPSIAAVHDGFPANQLVYPVATHHIATVPTQPREHSSNIRVAGATRIKIKSPLITKPLALSSSSEAVKGKENDKGDVQSVSR